MAEANIKVTFMCPVEKVWNVVTSLTEYQWRSDISRIEVIDEAHFQEITPEGFRTTFTVTKKEPYKLWEFELENANIKGNWVGRFYPQGDRTTLDFTEYVTARKFYLKPFVGSFLRKQQKQYFVDLKKALQCEEASKIQIL